MRNTTNITNYITKIATKAINLPLKLQHYTIHYYNYQILYNHCCTNHSHNLDLSSIYNIHSYHQHYLDFHIGKLLGIKKGYNKEHNLE